MNIEFTLNGRSVATEIEPGETTEDGLFTVERLPSRSYGVSGQRA